MRLGVRGQAAGLMGIILVGFVAALIAMNFSGPMSDTASDSADNMRYGLGSDTTYATLNANIDNILVVAPWENGTSSSRTVAVGGDGNAYLDTAGGSGSAEWWQDLVVGDFDSITSATIDAAYWFMENDNVTDVLIEIDLVDADSVINAVFVSTAKKENANWVTLSSIDVSGYITKAGTYRIALYDAVTRSGSSPSIHIGFDNAQLSITAHSYAAGAAAGGELVELSGGLLWAVVVVAIVIGIGFGALKYSGVV